MPYWNFEYTKAVIYTVVKVGGGIGQDPATEVTHLRLNQPPVYTCGGSGAYSPKKFLSVQKSDLRLLSTEYALQSTIVVKGFMVDKF